LLRKRDAGDRVIVPNKMEEGHCLFPFFIPNLKKQMFEIQRLPLVTAKILLQTFFILILFTVL